METTVGLLGTATDTEKNGCFTLILILILTGFSVAWYLYF